MTKFTLDISDIGNDKNQENSYYHRLTSYIEKERLLTEDDCYELVLRIEAFIEQEIDEIRDENWHTYNEEDEEDNY
jgi:hypothetical protein|tara:strand:+ start:61 stop:288 length:228 start_codon:yes stop_codon:yes gene_type:complete